jgi:hypothetical protein
MGKIGNRSGGGIEGNKVSHVSSPKREPHVDQIDPRRPSQIGLSHYLPKAPLYQSSVASTPIGATPSVAGPGGGRMVLERGTQAHHVNRPMPKGRDLFK